MVQTRSRAQARPRLTRAKSIWKPNSTSEKRRGLDEECTEDVRIEERSSIGRNSVDETLVRNVESVDQDATNDVVSNEQEQELYTEGLMKDKKVVHFNDKGQSIGEGSAPFACQLGSITRKHLPVSYKTWHDVPSQTRDTLWKLVTDMYDIPVAYKLKVLERMRFCWKKYKGVLRTKYYDMYNTDEERKRHCPKGVKQDVWNKFVDNQSTPAAQAQRIRGKNARQAVKTIHVTGRSGAARVAEALKKKNPSGNVTRTDLYLAMYSRKDGSCPTPEQAEKVEKIKAVASENPSSVNLDIYHDPVAQVCGLNKEKKVIHFNDKGQPIGEGSSPFTSELGSITRKHCPVSYKMWREVPSQTKENLWTLVTEKYVIPEVFKLRVLERSYCYWKKFKSILRTKYYDIYSTDEERKRNCPKGVKQDDWNKFVDNQSTPAAQAQRIRGKNARQAMKTIHVTGRSGAARVAEALKKQNPSGNVTRTEIYLAMFSRKDGSCPTPELTEKVEKIKAIALENPSSINFDIYHDPVAQVCGPEKSGGSVRGLGAGVSKAFLRYSAPATHLLEQERALRIAAEKRIADLREKEVSPEPADTHSSGTPWFQNTPNLRKRKSITEPNDLASSSCKKRKGFEDDDVEMDYEDEEDATSVSSEDGTAYR